MISSYRPKYNAPTIWYMVFVNAVENSWYPLEISENGICKFALYKKNSYTNQRSKPEYNIQEKFTECMPGVFSFVWLYLCGT